MDKTARISFPLFFILLFVISWIGAIPMVMVSWTGTRPSLPIRFLQILMLFGPGIVSIVVAGINEGKSGVKGLLSGFIRWRLNLLWYLLVLLGPAIICLIARQVGGWLGVSFAPLSSLSALLTAFATTFAVYFLLNSEEVAWRGYALPRLQFLYGPTRASLILGILWGVFHVPIFLMKGGHPAGFPFALYMVMVMGMTFIFTWVFNATKGSLLLVHLLHQSVNSSAETIPFYPKACGSVIPMIIVIIIFSICAIAIWLTRFRSYSAPVEVATPS
jgi:CAAX protease family protein